MVVFCGTYHILSNFTILKRIWMTVQCMALVTQSSLCTAMHAIHQASHIGLLIACQQF